MIPVKNTMVDFDTLPGEEIEFGIGDPRWVMKTQADLYSDITTAIIREYSTNAYDAHVMAGNPDPIQVTLPSMMDHFFVVEDKGVGMSLDLLRKIYTQFGVSDKRESATTNGMLGYGSKSGVAYTPQFSVTTIKDGVKYYTVIRRKPDWSIVLKVVSTTQTSEPNGTKIVIPVHNVEEFNHKAKEFFKFWLPGRVLVNGQEPAHDVGEKITEGLYYSTHWNESYVVMSNVAYRINNPHALFRDTKMNAINFVAYVDSVGEGDDIQAAVEFTPSREDLKYTDHTKATLQKVINNFETQIVNAAKADIAKATTHAEAFLAWSKWTSTLGRALFTDLEFKGDKFRSDFDFVGQRWQTNSSYNAACAIRQWHVEQMHNTMVVHDFPIQLSSGVKSKAKAYAKLKDWKHSYILFTPQSADAIKSKWITKDQFVSWDDLKAELPKVSKASRAGTGPRRLKGTFDLINRNGRQWEQPLPDDDTDVFYVSVQDEKRYSVRNILNHLDSSANVVILGANRIAKFNRDNPGIEDIVTYARSRVVEKGAELLSDDAKAVLSIEYTTRNWLNRLDLSRVDDPLVHEWERLVKHEAVLMEKYHANAALGQLVGVYVKPYSPGKQADISARYPLLGHLSYFRATEKDTYVYMNAKYAQEYKALDSGS